MSENTLRIPTDPRALAEFVGKMIGQLNSTAGAIRRLEALVQQGQGAGQVGAAASGMAGLPAIPGSIWALLAKLAWSDPELVRAHSIPIEALIQGAVDGGGLPIDGVAVTPNADVVARAFFVVHTIQGWVERDPSNPLENESSAYVTLQIEDDARQWPIFRESIRMTGIAGTAGRPGNPIGYAEYPLTFIPGSRIITTFQPLAGFPSAASGVTQLTTRRVGVHMHGVLVAEQIVDRLVNENRALLGRASLLTGR